MSLSSSIEWFSVEQDCFESTPAVSIFSHFAAAGDERNPQGAADLRLVGHKYYTPLAHAILSREGVRVISHLTFLSADA